MDSLTSRPDYALEVLELMPDALVLIDTQQRIVHVNRQAEDLFQKSAAEILGQPLKTLLPQLDFNRSADFFLKSAIFLGCYFDGPCRTPLRIL